MTDTEARDYGPDGVENHGHVWPRTDGRKARCGGSTRCKVCQSHAEQAKRPDSADYVVKLFMVSGIYHEITFPHNSDIFDSLLSVISWITQLMREGGVYQFHLVDGRLIAVNMAHVVSMIPNNKA